MEMASHLEIAIEENLKQGMSVEEARRQASVRFGGVEQAKQQRIVFSVEAHVGSIAPRPREALKLVQKLLPAVVERKSPPK